MDTNYNLSESSSINTDLSPSLFEFAPIINLPSKQGWLYKKTTGLIPRWIKRYFSLSNLELSYYYSESKSKFGGVLNFNLLTIEIQVKQNVFKIVALGGKRIFKLKTLSEQETLDWVFAITMHINASEGRKAVLSIASKSKFWKFNRISENDFKINACTGDILLFRGKDFVSGVQRLFTKSEYDHVAFILKYASGKIALFEATGLDGVNIVYWDDFRFYQWENLYSRIIYRKLDFDRNESVLEELESLIRKVRGKKYRISPSKLMSNKNDKDPSIKAGFFCSELVATAYKAIGILPELPPASKYWPGDFSDGKKLRLVGGAKLHPGLLIDFDIK